MLQRAHSQDSGLERCHHLRVAQRLPDQRAQTPSRIHQGIESLHAQDTSVPGRRICGTNAD